MSTGLIYKDKPLFGLDIGTSSVKVMQIENHGKSQVIVGYGVTNYDQGALKDGLVADPEILAKATKELFDKQLIGEISTRRVALSVPVARTYNRVMNLPAMNKKDLDEAVRLEAEQYIPVPIDDLYIDYNISSSSKDGYELLAVAVPKQIIDSYLTYTDLLGLEVSTIETTINASSRLIAHSERDEVPTILIDFGSVSVDITIFDKELIVTGTVAGGGDTFTELIAKKLDVSNAVAHTIKTKYGLSVSKKQKDIQDALKPILGSLTREIRKMVRYYDERSGSEGKIGQIITMGGGANMPGLSEFITSELRLPTRMCNPWANLDFGKLQPPSTVEKSMYVTAAGLALITPKDIWK
jgi:type IV pilus assembly protein PilM